MKKNKYIIYILVGLMVFAGCAKMPDEVKQENDRSETQAESSNKENEYQFVKIDSILDGYKEVISNTYDNLIFEEGLVINKPEEIGKYKFEQINNFADEGEKKIQDLFGAEFNEQMLLVDDRGYEYDDQQKRNYYGMSDSGFYSFFTDDYYDILREINRSECKLIDLVYLNKQYDDPSYLLEDGSMKLSTALEQAKKFAKKMYKDNQDMQWTPYQVLIYERNDKTFFYDIYFYKVYKNVYFTAVVPEMFKNKDEEGHYVPYTIMSGTHIIINSKDAPKAYANPCGIIECNEVEEKYDKVLSLESAADIVSSTLSEYSKYTVKLINIENRLIRINGEPITEDMDPNPFDYTPGNIYESEPYWVFYFDLTRGDEVYAMVNCITGEFEFWDKSK